MKYKDEMIKQSIETTIEQLIAIGCREETVWIYRRGSNEVRSDYRKIILPTEYIAPDSEALFFTSHGTIRYGSYWSTSALIHPYEAIMKALDMADQNKPEVKSLRKTIKQMCQSINDWLANMKAKGEEVRLK